MTEKKNNTEKNQQTIEFSIFVPEASSVCVSGDFNDWDTEKHPMEKNRIGVWTKNLRLPPGNYEYKYVVDDSWFEMPKNDCCLNEYGTYNNIVHVPEKPTDL